ncbi:hypothetical protein [Pyrobaculum ferrireducens]|nr:hypothetical protein [Pyrobaculum ferrireducens]
MATTQGAVEALKSKALPLKRPVVASTWIGKCVIISVIDVLNQRLCESRRVPYPRSAAGAERRLRGGGRRRRA